MRARLWLASGAWILALAPAMAAPEAGEGTKAAEEFPRARFTFGSLGGKRQVVVDASHVYYLVTEGGPKDQDPKGQLRIVEKPAVAAGADALPSPAPIAQMKLEGLPEALEWAGDRVLCASTGNHLVFIDVSAPAEPRIAAELPVARREIFGASEVKRAGRFLYLAARKQGILRVDIADPLRPRLDGSLALPGFATGLDVRGDLLVAATGIGLAFVRLSEEGMRLESTLDTFRNAEVVRILGERLACASKEYVFFYDISDPLGPRELGEVSTRDPFYYSHLSVLHVTESHVFACAGEGGLYVWDWKDPRDARLAVQFSFWGNEHRLAPEDKVRYARAIGLAGSDEELARSFPKAENISILAVGMAVDGSRVYLSDHKGKLWALEVVLDGAPSARCALRPEEPPKEKR